MILFFSSFTYKMPLGKKIKKRNIIKYVLCVLYLLLQQKSFQNKQKGGNNLFFFTNCKLVKLSPNKSRHFDRRNYYNRLSSQNVVREKNSRLFSAVCSLMSSQCSHSLLVLVINKNSEIVPKIKAYLTLLIKQKYSIYLHD